MKISRGNKIIMAVIGAGLALVVVLAGFILWDADYDMAADPANISVQSPQTDVPPDGFQEAAMEPLTSEQRNQTFEDRLVLELQRKYGKIISEISTQASLLDVQKQIISLFPGDEGLTRFHRILRRAFPDHADDVIATLAKLAEYQRWLEDNEGLFAQMTALERKAALLEKRNALFGEDANEIWSGELLANEARTAAMQDTMTVLGESRDTTIEEKLDVYQGALRQTYEESPDAHVLDQRFMLTKVFFSIESVQEELKTMSPDQRQYKMNQIRREMGFSEEEIENMEVLDADRSRRWDAGLKYMEEREAVVSQYDDEEQGEQLKALREKYFQDEANTIELEEKEEFFRFKRPHIYGRN